MVARGIALTLVGLSSMGALLFGAAGRLDLPWLWAYWSTWVLAVLVVYGVAMSTNPDLVRERMRPPNDRDRATRALAALPGLGHFVAAGIDVGRVGWSSIGVGGHVFGLFLLWAGWALIAWTFATNRFASSAVRIQSDRDHEVITSGPYAWVRHPMYTAVLLVVAGAGPAVGSWWATLCLLPLVPIFIRRTRLEDRMLHEELPGYPEYAEQTRFRIIPGVY
ncbi:MAG: isoprenylcysteine carboxylmethyltransferase family protein [Myxococcota bacterium]